MSFHENRLKLNEEFFKRYFSYTIGQSFEEDSLKKVLFLDIDGVLTREFGGDLKLDDDIMKRLKKIIDETGAKVVLSSSRKRWYKDYIKDPINCDDFKKADSITMKNTFDKYGINIIDWPCDVTLRGYAGYRTRPYEIQAWLLGEAYLESFVILDDEPWSWGWLSEHVVRTVRNDPNRKYEKFYGLEDEHVKRAIEILNQYDGEDEEY